jgi:hypothetical protein
MTLETKLAQAAESGLQQLLLYRTASGAWDCTARVVIGHAVRKTPEAAMGGALDEFLAGTKPKTGSVFD